MNNDMTLRIIVLNEGDVLVAQCLEYDICTSATDMDSLQNRMNGLIECELDYTNKTGQEIDPAPERFHNMWDKAITQANGEYEYRLAA